MKNKILSTVTTLLVGAILGGVAYNVVQNRFIIQKKIVYTPPANSVGVLDTGKAFTEIVSTVSPVVVNISTSKTIQRVTQPFYNDPFFDQQYNPFSETPGRWKEQSLGSGVIVTDDGYIITNNHVIEHADEIKVTLYDKRSFKGKVIGTDPKTDIALIKIKAKGLPSIPWTDSEKLKVGEFVLAIGNPFGLNHTVTMGIVSAIGRANVGIADYEDFIQTDAAINPGNSGGPLVNIQGELVGINTAIFSRSGGYQGVGFAVPSNMVRLIVEQLRTNGKVVRGWLGVTIQDLTAELAANFGLEKPAGALVSDIFNASPAERAGIMRGDIIIEFGGKEITNVSSLRNAVARTSIGSATDITVVRNRKRKRFRITISEFPKELSDVSSQVQDVVPDREVMAGLGVTELTDSIAKQLGINQSVTGVVVVDVEPGTPAHEAGIRKGDLIQEVNSKRIKNINDWEKAISSLDPGDMVVLFIDRSSRKFYIALKP
jgi:serine protease Do